MANVNPFAKYVQQDPDDKPAAIPSVDAANPFARFAQKDPETPKDERGWLEKTGQFGLDALRNFNDTLTFGGYNRALEATGIQPDADELLEKADRENPWAGVLGDTAGFVLPGMGASAAVSKAVPKLAGNGLRQIAGREFLANAGVSAADDLARQGQIDPMGVGIDAFLGGGAAFGLGALGRTAPSARVRAAGNNLTDADRLGAEFNMLKAQEQGIPLNVPEALGAAAPTRAQGVQRAYDDAVSTPQGATAASSFEAGRGPLIEQAGRDLAGIIGPGADPFLVSNAAGDAIKRNAATVQASAQPYFDSAARRNLPPTWTRGGASVETATRELLNSPEEMEFLRASMGLPKGAPIPRNSVPFQDAVRKKLAEMGKQAQTQEKDLLGSLRFSAAEDVGSTIERVAPDYGTAMDITEQGLKRVDQLKAGPLGQIANNPRVSAQSSLFAPTNAVDADINSNALKQLGAQDPSLPRGILANAVDTAVTKSGSGFGRDVLPNDYARMMAGETLGPEMADVTSRLETAAMVDPFNGSMVGNDASSASPIGMAWAGIRNAGKGKIAKMLQDPATVQKLGKTGPVQRGITMGAEGLIQAGDFGGRFTGKTRNPRKRRRDKS